MSLLRRFAAKLTSASSLWIDSHSSDPNAKHANAVYASQSEAKAGQARAERMDWVRCIPFILLHLSCFAVILVGWSWTAVGVAVMLYVVRMHAITGWYHRYFSHRSFRTGRIWQFIWAAIGNSSAQRGPLWWAAHHRHHHRYSDEEQDIHSPMLRGFWWSHMGWFTARINFRTQLELVPDLVKYPELVWLDRFDIVAPFALGFACWLTGVGLAHWAPALGTNGWQMLVWFFISTVVTAHATFTINSLAHVFGTRRYPTSDTSRNNFLLALVTLGEGWHNNHHHYQSAARQGFRWWEVDVTWYLLLLQRSLGLVRDLKSVPPHVLIAASETSTETSQTTSHASAFPATRDPAA